MVWISVRANNSLEPFTQSSSGGRQLIIDGGPLRLYSVCSNTFVVILRFWILVEDSAAIFTLADDQLGQHGDSNNAICRGIEQHQSDGLGSRMNGLGVQTGQRQDRRATETRWASIP